MKIGPKKAIDLDKVSKLKRSDIESSKSLKWAERKGKIKIRHSSRSDSREELPPEPAAAPDMSETIAQIRDAVRQEVKDQLGSPAPVAQDNPAMMALLEKMSKMMENQSHSSGHSTSSAPQKVEDDDDIDFDHLADIHAKSVGRKVKDVKGRIGYTEQKSSGGVSKNADELDGLLG